ncbi:hypothetical protein D3C83_163710 [compost metagenome]
MPSTYLLFAAIFLRVWISQVIVFVILFYYAVDRCHFLPDCYQRQPILFVLSPAVFRVKQFSGQARDAIRVVGFQVDAVL